MEQQVQAAASAGRPIPKIAAGAARAGRADDDADGDMAETQGWSIRRRNNANRVCRQIY
jgi:hypothetical protein